MDRKAKDKVIGIDLGTTYSCVGVWQHDRIEIIANDQGNRTTPSMVAFTPDERLVGDAAKFQISTNPTNTVFDVKRLIGRTYNDPSVQSDKQLWPFTVIPGKNDKPMVEVTYKGEKRLFAAEEISSMVLVKMKTIAEQYLQCGVKKAVITVPAYFNDSQKRATKDAGKIAGLDVMRIINEPTAAAITYGFDALEEGTRNILVFDLGGGTFDVSIVTVERGKVEVKAVGGDMHLGGGDFDNRMLNYCVQLFNKKYKMDIGTNPKVLRRLRSECERAKRSLSSAVETVIDIDSLYEGQDFHTKIRRAKFEELNADLFDKCMQVVKQCLEDSKLSKHQINDIVLVGGSSRIPKVQELVSQFFEGKELCKSVNPDEAVAYGAALQAAVLNKENIHLVLMDVTPLSLGISVDDGIMKVVVPRNTPIPTLKESSVTTRFDNQTSVSFPIYEGERTLDAHNNLLGEFVLDGIPPARCGVPKIRVFFKVDEEGILTASAKDVGTGRNNQITVTNERERLCKEEIDRMVADAHIFHKEDEEMAKKHLAKNTLECYICNMKSRLMEAKNRGTMQIRVADDISGALNIVEEWLDENDNAAIEKFKAKLNELSLKCKCLT
ncbi:heat shock cognate 70 kDa protein isoform X1 [Cryptomeria japonica]|uniref:heat shock cognate 70 kDa protein isoform X1 n=1 Tax=Cryptomeria japonica TaxID=3369 RepID=UPI0025AB9929|nr:heat shock cognate 70 kDa protein isoform X1 [Cryptomeria japonica]XP_057846099.1 heat shock cognate 70 kDa protein isoform X1 [Cryptomeria japonica]XP_057846100.1 heat shock cognate 70 kDa protein isoform X1 [Cryptomeria japonica]XP_057846101.1 heat shock cognate 70 kDa protein isoform X1 [Cryptomeria japonica]XP_057846102.1 heat shock cognate 70 kDa protein isoform X1 [Cryptomeria japonica]XP_057846103.1 heat shock cognate 70 kDa protein isoform X1 [Cryptomeria japonica]